MGLFDFIKEKIVDPVRDIIKPSVVKKPIKKFTDIFDNAASKIKGKSSGILGLNLDFVKEPLDEITNVLSISENLIKESTKSVKFIPKLLDVSTKIGEEFLEEIPQMMDSSIELINSLPNLFQTLTRILVKIINGLDYITKDEKNIAIFGCILLVLFLYMYRVPSNFR